MGIISEKVNCETSLIEHRCKRTCMVIAFFSIAFQTLFLSESLLMYIIFSVLALSDATYTCIAAQLWSWVK